MFVEHKPEYLSSTQSHTPPSCHSMASSFSEPWEAAIMTPTTPPRSSNCVKLENEYATSSSSFYNTPEKFGASLEYSQLSHIPEDSMSAYLNVPIEFSRDMQASTNNSFMMYNTLEYDGLPGTTGSQGLSSVAPSLDMDPYSPSGSGSSQASADFVVPSQTTFLNALEFQSPMKAVGSMHFDLSYDSPTSSHFASDFPMDNSPTGNLASSMTYFMPQSFDYKSASATPQKPQFRQPICSGLPSSLALRQVTNIPSLKRETTALVKRKLKREVREDIPPNMKVHPEAKHQCMWLNCDRKFQRKEHLRRHERKHAGTDAFPCIFCEKVFNRCDNLKQHVWIHCQPKKKASRTDYYPEAILEFNRMNTKKRKPVRTPVPKAEWQD
ncbi:C2H2 and C2HC zinc finger [Glarea lozoyensis ATCC 20868]|uniref:C2H2 and C2HC zinc finger n=1 Tax=Glarea lozoyensis (strain ATCC 20868 / MF5171) TaxID=1116229 RepID=S3D5U8_GLAL2|nr:C2H2 and C2HC zinc finger [Glarea lozoyensis ATCC 20868]EPE33135.1 C2H2 and C2HC zinc finger [Glarea lozoyensis ATCC 20868]